MPQWDYSLLCSQTGFGYLHVNRSNFIVKSFYFIFCFLNFSMNLLRCCRPSKDVNDVMMIHELVREICGRSRLQNNSNWIVLFKILYYLVKTCFHSSNFGIRGLEDTPWYETPPVSSSLHAPKRLLHAHPVIIPDVLPAAMETPHSRVRKKPHFNFVSSVFLKFYSLNLHLCSSENISPQEEPRAALLQALMFREPRGPSGHRWVFTSA